MVDTIEWQAKLDKYPSLKKLDEAGDDYVEWNDGREEALLAAIKVRPDFAALRGNPHALLQAMDEFASNQDLLISVGSDKAAKLSELLETERPRVVVELGGYLGYSAILFATKLRDLFPNDASVKVWSIEMEPRFAAIAQEFVEIAGLAEHVSFVVGKSEEALRGLKAAHGVRGVDFLFLDHAEDLYLQDFKLVVEELQLMKKGSVVVADNCIRPGAPQYVEYVRTHTGMESKGLKAYLMPGEFEDEMEVTRIL